MIKKLCKCGCGQEIKDGSTWARGHNPNKTKDRFDWSNLEKDYNKLRNVEKVAEKYGCTAAAVSYQMKKRNIKAFHEKPVKEIDSVIKIYEKHGTLEKTAEFLGVNKKTVRHRLEDAGYKINHNNKKLESVVGLGRYGERIAMKVMKGSVDISGTNLHHPYDIEWEGKKIDVKTARPRHTKRTNQYFFNIKNHECTHFFFVLLDSNDNPWKMFLIPYDQFKSTSVFMSTNTVDKYKKYEMGINSDELRKINLKN